MRKYLQPHNSQHLLVVKIYFLWTTVPAQRTGLSVFPENSKRTTQGMSISTLTLTPPNNRSSLSADLFNLRLPKSQNLRSKILCYHESFYDFSHLPSDGSWSMALAKQSL